MQEADNSKRNGEGNSDSTSSDTVSDLEENQADVGPNTSEPGPSPDGAFDEAGEMGDADPV